jgi:hypothetical protein
MFSDYGSTDESKISHEQFIGNAWQLRKANKMFYFSLVTEI